MPEEMAVENDQDALKIHFKMSQFKYTQRAVRKIHYTLPGKDSWLGARTKPLPSEAMGPSQKVLWYPKDATWNSSIGANDYVEVRCLDSRMKEFPDAKYIMSSMSSGGPRPDGTSEISITETLLSEISRLPNRFVDNCRRHLQNLPINNDVTNVVSESEDHKIMKDLLDRESKMTPQQMAKKIDEFYAGNDSWKVFTLASIRENSNQTSRWLATLKLVKEDRFGLIQRFGFAGTWTMQSRELKEMFNHEFERADAQTRRRLEIFKDAFSMSLERFIKAHHECRDPEGKITNSSALAMVAGTYKTRCPENSPSTKEFVAKYTVPSFCPALTEPSGEIRKSDNCAAYDGISFSSKACMYGYELQAVDGTDLCIPN